MTAVLAAAFPDADPADLPEAFLLALVNAHAAGDADAVAALLAIAGGPTTATFADKVTWSAATGAGGQAGYASSGGQFRTALPAGAKASAAASPASPPAPPVPAPAAPAAAAPARAFGRNTFASLPEHTDGIDPATNAPAADLAAHAAAGVAAMPPASCAAIAAYTGEDYATINPAMRACPPEFGCLSPALKASVDSIEAGIAAAGPLPRPVSAYRAIDAGSPAAAYALVEAFRDSKDFESGPVTLPSLTSTSLSRDTAEGFGRPGTGVVFHVRAKSGLYVESITENKGERELLLSSKARYNVVNVVSMPGQPHLVELQEV